MKNIFSDMGVVQNLGWIDRVVRVVVSALMIVVPVILMSMQGTAESWMLYVMLVAIYPLLTGILGFDPMYYLLDLRTCGMSGRNRCGSFPFEIDAALGRNPVSRSKISNELDYSRHVR